jgi:SAM-dependent MidA family methyltransferase
VISATLPLRLVGDDIDDPSFISRYKGNILRDSEGLMQLEQQISLPEADGESAAHSARVAKYVRRKIEEAGGSISFAEYMHHALYAPGLGYYNAGTTKFGATGDFVTAPEVSSVFGGVIARQCAAVMTELDSFSILELGAGSGRLAADMLLRLSDLDALPDRYLILEVSTDLYERQKSLLQSSIPELIDRVTWLDQLPDEHVGVIVANEVLDALPVERFVRRGDSVLQVRVASDVDRFVIEEHAAPENLLTAVQAIEDDLGHALPNNYVSDVSLAASALTWDLARMLRQGVMFLFDYGVSRREYYAQDRSGGWLRCHFRHHAHNDPLILPGIQDMTTWVDFSAVAQAAVENELEVTGFVTQAQFLIAGGLDQELAEFSELPIDAQLKLSAQVKLLTLPGEMGENFKCLGLSRGGLTRPAAFGLVDRTASL